MAAPPARARRRARVTQRFLIRQAEHAEDALQIVHAVILDFDLPALFAEAERDVGGEVLLEPVLQVLDGGRHFARGRRLPAARRFRRAGALEMLRHEPLRSAHGEAAADDFVGERALLGVLLQGEEHLGVAHGDAALHEPALHLGIEIEQPHGIRHRGAALADFLRDVFLLQAKVAGQPGEGGRFLDRRSGLRAGDSRSARARARPDPRRCGR